MLSLFLASFLTFVELNCENLFDCQHDTLKEDYEFLSDGSYHWTPNKYWKKLNHIGQALLSCGGDTIGSRLPDIIALTEVENDTVMRDLTKRSLLRNAHYDYVMTSSRDVRGIDVALMYSPFSFRPMSSKSIRVDMPKGQRPTRDILYVKGTTLKTKSMHIFVVHAPSRMSGEMNTRPLRMLVAKKLCETIDSISQDDAKAHIVVMGDFNDYTTNAPLQYILQHGMYNVTDTCRGSNGAKATYKYHGEWGSIDHIFVNGLLRNSVVACRINDAQFLIEEDKKYGGIKPFRNFYGRTWQNGYSDHLPLVMTISM